MNFSSHIFYFVIYPQGACGHHLANLINLDDSFNSPHSDLTKEEFSLYLEYFYKSYNFNEIGLSKRHTKFHTIIGGPEWLLNLKTLDFSFKNSIHKGHKGSFIKNYYNQIIQTFKNHRQILIQCKTKRSLEILEKRKIKLPQLTETVSDVVSYNNLFLPLLNESPYFSPEHVITLELEEIFKSDIKDVLKNINQKFTLNIPEDKAQNLHDLWYNSNIS